jgi:protein-tyrosine phosphatase
MSSANSTGAAPLAEAADVAARFGASDLLILDGGRARLGEASAVLRLGRGAFELLRPGLYSIEELRRAAGLRLGFACTGNTCRSPMAEALAEKLVAGRLGIPVERLGEFGFEVSSLGIAAWPGSPASAHAVEALRELDTPLVGHVARAAVDLDLARFDCVYGMTSAHCEALSELVPPGRRPNIERLDPAQDVPDPVGAPLDVYRRTAATIRAALEARAADWV